MVLDLDLELTTDVRFDWVEDRPVKGTFGDPSH